MSKYTQSIEDLVMSEDEDNTVLNMTFTGQSMVLDGGDLYLETVMDISDGSKYRTWLANDNGNLIWDDML